MVRQEIQMEPEPEDQQTATLDINVQKRRRRPLSEREIVVTLHASVRDACTRVAEATGENLTEVRGAVEEHVLANCKGLAEQVPKIVLKRIEEAEQKRMERVRAQLKGQSNGHGLE